MTINDVLRPPIFLLRPQVAMTTQTIFFLSGSSLYAPDYAYQPRQLLDWAFIVTFGHCCPTLLQNSLIGKHHPQSPITMSCSQPITHHFCLQS